MFVPPRGLVSSLRNDQGASGMNVFQLIEMKPSAQLAPTVVVVSRQVFGVDVEVVVCVKLPELAVDDVEVLIGEVVGDLVDVVLLLQQGQRLQEVASAQLHHADPTRP